MLVVDGQEIPLGSTLALGQPAEVTLAEEALAQVKVPRNGPGHPKQRPNYPVDDKAYDSIPPQKTGESNWFLHTVETAKESASHLTSWEGTLGAGALNGPLFGSANSGDSLPDT